MHVFIIGNLIFFKVVLEAFEHMDYDTITQCGKDNKKTNKTVNNIKVILNERYLFENINKCKY